MKDRVEKLAPAVAASREILSLGKWLGRHQAFSMIATRCTAADAECLKTMRDSGEYKKVGLNWEEFCKQHAGITRSYADRLIRHLDEFGANYFRLAELIQISSDTYRLIAGAVSEEGIEFAGERIPLAPENRERILKAVDSMRQGGEEPLARLPSASALAKRLDGVVAEARLAVHDRRQREKMIEVLDRGRAQLSEIVAFLRVQA